MKASVCIEMIYTEVPFLDRIRLAAEQGYDAVEFWNWDNKDMPAIKEAVRRAVGFFAPVRKRSFSTE